MYDHLKIKIFVFFLKGMESVKVKILCQAEASKRAGIKISFRAASMHVVSRDEVLGFIDDDRAAALVRPVACLVCGHLSKCRVLTTSLSLELGFCVKKEL